MQAGLEAARFSHGLGAVFLDYNGDGRPDLYIANDEDPNELYENVPWPGGVKADPAGLGFRFEERAVPEGVADAYAGMGVAAAGYDGSGRMGLFVTNSRREPSAAFLQQRRLGVARVRKCTLRHRSGARYRLRGLGRLMGRPRELGVPDLVVAAGAIPVTNLATDAEPVRVVAPLSGKAPPVKFGNAVGVLPAAGMRLNGRGLAAADVGNDGRMDIAVNTIGGRLVLLRSTGPIGHWLEVATSPLTPGTTVTAISSRRKPPRSRGAVRQQLPVLRGLPTALRPRPCHRIEGADRPLPLRRRARAAGTSVPTGSSSCSDPRPAVQRQPAAVSDAIASCSRPNLHGHSIAEVWDTTARAVLTSRECRPARRRARPVPPLGCDVGCLGRVRPDSRRLLRHCKGAGR